LLFGETVLQRLLLDDAFSLVAKDILGLVDGTDLGLVLNQILDSGAAAKLANFLLSEILSLDSRCSTSATGLRKR
jgi:hypothetical protein